MDISIGIRKHGDTLTNQLHNLIRALGPIGRQRMLSDAGREFIRITKENFGDEGKYRGNKWKPLSKRYAKKVGSSVATLLRSGALRDSIKVGSPRGNWIEVSTSNPYARAQFLGNPKQNLPSRLYFPTERISTNYWRPVYAAEKELVHAIGKSLYIISGGAFSKQLGAIPRSYPTRGNPTQPPGS